MKSDKNIIKMIAKHNSKGLKQKYAIACNSNFVATVADHASEIFVE